MKLIYHKTFGVSEEEANQPDHPGFHDNGTIPDIERAILDCAGHECIIEVRRGRKI